eukprot:CAMPEP_0197585170 /NCGR_PEP_ID=MMETSP1326-20131121/7553_1 /TAXON_ID=1155430 /ORGANISM="Genus nov. species nov., Strain RCC2288" /LENGTH=128 /DNA_ID=CAMNT_0043149635 /DNA_START=36 /DNA_END=422 /DNA_ORIENTATION=+
MAAISMNLAGLAPRTTRATRKSRMVCMAKGGGAEPVKIAKAVKGSAKQPPWFPDAKVICNGVEIMSVGGTQAEYIVDIWSGNHPFFLGKSGAIMMDAGQVSRFASKYGDLGVMSAVQTIDDAPDIKKK